MKTYSPNRQTRRQYENIFPHTRVVKRQEAARHSGLLKSSTLCEYNVFTCQQVHQDGYFYLINFQLKAPLQRRKTDKENRN